MDYSFAMRLALCVILVTSSGFAENKEEEGKTLVDHAKQLSDIRAEGAPAFRLRTSFKIINKDSTVHEGTYIETWVSRSQWRREIILGDFREIVVGNEKKRWDLKSTSAVPEGMEYIGFQMASLRFSPGYWKPEKIEDREIHSLNVRCIETKRESGGGRSSICFDKGTGTLAAEILPLEVLDRTVNKTCEYGDYQKFGGKVFPRATKCFEGPKPTFEETLLELSADPPLDPQLFAALVGGTETVLCQGAPKPPIPVYSPAPKPPNNLKPKIPVILRLTVETDGKTQVMRVVQSVDKAFDSAAIEAVQQWRFKPATCDGQPIATQLNVEIKFAMF